MRITGSYQAGIYTITCEPTGKVYVGQAKNMSRRWTSHRWSLEHGEHRNRHLQNAWRKHGRDAFTFAIARTFPALSGDALRSALSAAEVEILALQPKTFNLMVAGQDSLVPSDEVREIWSIQRKQMWSDPAYRERVRATHLARPKDPTIGERIAATQRLPHNRAAKSEHFKALWATEEFREARTKELQDVWKSDGYRERQSASRSASWERNREDRTKSLQAVYDDPVRGAARRKKFSETVAKKPSVSKSALALMAKAKTPVNAAQIQERAWFDGGRLSTLESVAVLMAKLVREGRAIRQPTGWTLP